MDLHQASRAEPAPGRKTTTLLRDRDLALPVTTIHGNRPGPRVLQWYAQQGGRHVVTGSDAHTAQDVGSHILQMEALARQLGLLPGAFVNHRWTEGTQHGL